MALPSLLKPLFLLVKCSPFATLKPTPTRAVYKMWFGNSQGQTINICKLSKSDLSILFRKRWRHVLTYLILLQLHIFTWDQVGSLHKKKYQALEEAFVSSVFPEIGRSSQKMLLALLSQHLARASLY